MGLLLHVIFSKLRPLKAEAFEQTEPNATRPRISKTFNEQTIALRMPFKTSQMSQSSAANQQRKNYQILRSLTTQVLPANFSVSSWNLTTPSHSSS